MNKEIALIALGAFPRQHAENSGLLPSHASKLKEGDVTLLTPA